MQIGRTHIHRFLGTHHAVGPLLQVRSYSSPRQRMEPRCPGSAPVEWVTPSECIRAGASSCGGDWNATWPMMVPRCAAGNGGVLRHFGRSATLHCFEQLAKARGGVGARVLTSGVSNMMHIFFAMEQDDSSKRWQSPRNRFAKPACKFPFTERLNGYLPHVLDFQPIQVVTPTRQIHHKTDASCWNASALGGGFGNHIVAEVEEPYDAVVLHVGTWDAAYTSRNMSGVQQGLREIVQPIVHAWPKTTIVLVTMTPCGGWVNEEHTGRLYTPPEGCDFFESLNQLLWRYAEAHAPRVKLLDAHQMVASRPGANVSGSPPGIWLNQSRGLHFALAASRAAREQQRRSGSAEGEMVRHIANRVFDVICP